MSTASLSRSSVIHVKSLVLALAQASEEVVGKEISIEGKSECRLSWD